MMQRIFGIALVAFSCAVINAHDDTPIEANRLDAQLDGDWILKSIQRGEEKVEGDDLPVRMRGTKRTIKGNQMILARGGAPRQLKCTITVDTSTKPKQMNVSVERNGEVRVLKCIYEIKDGILKIAENDTERPKTFATDRSSTRTMVSTYARQSN